METSPVVHDVLNLGKVFRPKGSGVVKIFCGCGQIQHVTLNPNHTQVSSHLPGLEHFIISNGSEFIPSLLQHGAVSVYRS